MGRKKKEELKIEVDTLENEVFLTQAGLQSLVDELDHLKNSRRKEVTEKIKAAISLGDLSENAEYEEAKNDQAFIEGRILEVEALIKNAKIFKEKKGQTGSVVQIGNTVELYNETTDEKEKFMIVGSIETDPLNNKISNESPVGAAVLGGSIDDKFTVRTPGGEVCYVIKKIY